MKADKNALVLHKGQPAIIVSRDADKFEIQLESGTKRVREKDFVILSPGPVVRIADVLDKTPPPADFTEAAEFFRDEPATFTDISELVWGPLSPEFAWACWREISSSPWFLCTTPNEPVTVRSAEEAAELVRAAEQKSGEETARNEFTLRLKNSAAGKPGGIIRPDDDRFLQEIEALALGTAAKSKALSRAGLSETPQLAHAILLSCGYWNDERNPWPYRHGLSLSTPQIEVSGPEPDSGRLDLTAMDSWAIDNEWSADPDDAVSLDNGILWVHVADPAETVRPDTPADLAARSRGSTLYVPEGASRMLSDQALEYYGLGLTATSVALSFRIEFADNGSIADVSVHRTLIRVTRKTYREVSEQAQAPQFQELFKIAERNIARRKAAGAVFIELPEVHLAFDPDKPLADQISIDRVESLPAADMVREMMLIAGEAAARFAFKNRIPFQYASQDIPDIPSALPEGLAGEYRKRRSMRGRKVGTIPADHAGLGLGMYAQVTSPLRRYGDLVVHQQLHRYLAGEPLMDTDDMLMRIAAGDAAARECTLAERESNLHWKLVYLMRHPDWQGTGVVVDKAGTTATILVPELGMEDRIPLPDANLNDSVLLSASGISLPEQRVSFTPIK
jgi:exoribonuclease-2